MERKSICRIIHAALVLAGLSGCGGANPERSVELEVGGRVMRFVVSSRVDRINLLTAGDGIAVPGERRSGRVVLRLGGVAIRVAAAFVDARGRVVDVVLCDPPDERAAPTLISRKPAAVALVLRKNSLDELGLAAGDRVGPADRLPGPTGGKMDHVILRVKGIEVRAEVAADPRQRRLGLMFRRSLPPGQGMLFVHRGLQVQSFWMRNTWIPLSIAFIAADGKITRILEMKVEPEGGPWPSYVSDSPVPYALEMPAGWFAAHGIEAGDRVEFPEGFGAETASR